MDYYPIWGPSIPAYPNASNLFLLGGILPNRISTLPDQSAAVFSVLQACGSDDFAGDGGRKPNYVESRFMAFDCVVRGGKGIMWWGAAFLNLNQPEDIAMWNDIKVIAGQLWDLSEPLSRGMTSTNFILGNGHLEGRMKLLDDFKYLIVVNRSANALSNVAITVPGWSGTSAFVLFENRLRSISSSAFTESFQPWEVHSYSDDAFLLARKMFDRDFLRDLVEETKEIRGPVAETERVDLVKREKALVGLR